MSPVEIPQVPAKESASLRVVIKTDGKTGEADVMLDGVQRHVPANKVTQASCSVRTNPSGSRVITATLWVAP